MAAAGSRQHHTSAVPAIGDRCPHRILPGHVRSRRPKKMPVKSGCIGPMRSSPSAQQEGPDTLDFQQAGQVVSGMPGPDDRQMHSAAGITELRMNRFRVGDARVIAR